MVGCSGPPRRSCKSFAEESSHPWPRLIVSVTSSSIGSDIVSPSREGSGNAKVTDAMLSRGVLKNKNMEFIGFLVANAYRG